MKIGPLDLKPLPPTAVAERKTTAATLSPAEASAQVALSSQAASAGSEASRADFDAAKVNRIAQAIRDGKFQIDAEAIADKLIANAQELLPGSPH